MTILEAVKVILGKEPGGLTCKEITSRIIDTAFFGIE